MTETAIMEQTENVSAQQGLRDMRNGAFGLLTFGTIGLITYFNASAGAHPYTTAATATALTVGGICSVWQGVKGIANWIDASSAEVAEILDRPDQAAPSATLDIHL